MGWKLTSPLATLKNITWNADIRGLVCLGGQKRACTWSSLNHSLQRINLRWIERQLARPIASRRPNYFAHHIHPTLILMTNSKHSFPCPLEFGKIKPPMKTQSHMHFIYTISMYDTVCEYKQVHIYIYSSLFYRSKSWWFQFPNARKLYPGNFMM